MPSKRLVGLAAVIAATQLSCGHPQSAAGTVAAAALRTSAPDQAARCSSAETANALKASLISKLPQLPTGGDMEVLAGREKSTSVALADMVMSNYDPATRIITCTGKITFGHGPLAPMDTGSFFIAPMADGSGLKYVFDQKGSISTGGVELPRADTSDDSFAIYMSSELLAGLFEHDHGQPQPPAEVGESAPSNDNAMN